MTEQQRQQYRAIAHVGVIFLLCLSSIVLVSLFGFQLTAEYFDVINQTRPLYLLEDTSSEDFIWLALLLMLPNSTIILGGVFTLLRALMLVPTERVIWREMLRVLLSINVIIWVILQVLAWYIEMFALNVAEYRMWGLIRNLLMYLVIWILGISGVSFGWLMWQLNKVPRWLCAVTIGCYSLSIMLNLFAFNTNLPSARILIGLNVSLPDIVAWTLFFWAISRKQPPASDTQPTRTDQNRSSRLFFLRRTPTPSKTPVTRKSEGPLHNTPPS